MFYLKYNPNSSHVISRMLENTRASGGELHEPLHYQHQREQL